MIGDARYDDDRLLVRFDADLHGQPVAIEVPRNLIEDRLQSPGMPPGDLVAFVTRNRQQIAENARYYTRHDTDVTGIIIGEEQLKHCD
jgi:hypothetical protein